MNFGIIGCGNIARKFVKSIEYTDEGKIYAIASHSLTSDDELKYIKIMTNYYRIENLMLYTLPYLINIIRNGS